MGHSKVLENIWVGCEEGKNVVLVYVVHILYRNEGHYVEPTHEAAELLRLVEQNGATRLSHVAENALIYIRVVYKAVCISESTEIY